MKALIMAGGEGKRMGLRSKPLLKFLGKEMIAHVIEALEKCREIEKIYVAVRKDDKKLIDFLKNKQKKNKQQREMRKNLELIITRGKGYAEDLKEIAEKEGKNLGKAITLSCDIPLINEKIIQTLIEEYLAKAMPAAGVYLPLKLFEELKINPTIIFDNKVSLVPAGVNFIDFSDLNASEASIVVNFRELAFNINTMKELKRAESYNNSKQKL